MKRETARHEGRHTHQTESRRETVSNSTGKPPPLTTAAGPHNPEAARPVQRHRWTRTHNGADSDLLTSPRAGYREEGHDKHDRGSSTAEKMASSSGRDQTASGLRRRDGQREGNRREAQRRCQLPREERDERNEDKQNHARSSSSL